MTTQAAENQVVRDTKTGRFSKGNRVKSPGRPPNAPKTLVQALKDRVDPDTAAAFLWERALVSDQVLIYVFNRLDGMPKQAVEVEHKDDPPAVKQLKELQQALLEKAKANGNAGS